MLLLRWVLDGHDKIGQDKITLGVGMEGALTDVNHGQARQIAFVVWVVSWDNDGAMH